ncbi:glycerol-3-phosphate 1-O-acyltransferase PlsY [Methylobacillus gramineus]|uniref:glycerol-3-phosphate 1-O-acyltransferase PlsY n=1 Tax=Methylobacillus gramineus TaxID=755169 RepID=UPI001D000AD0|nr:glycerol-3-phosphate 1-O-acyltransferase PlsY [Methylobacillus gramineus]MCB5186121.1 glycerol-3-phosphate 1-O-acyltransferase PlsY [Methylobacillus gramineus]
MNNAVFVILAYLLGSISFGILVSKAFGLPDPRTVGSGNPGATNVLRSGKKLAALLTLLGDAAKGWLPVWLAQYYGLQVEVVCWIAVAVFLGHLYPVFYRFKGGKGVATALGVLFAFAPLLAGLAMLSWITIFALTRFSSLAALTAAALAPGFAWILLAHVGYIIVVFILSVLLIWRHRSNIRKLLDGTESGFGKKP